MSHESFIALHGRGGKILTKLAAVDGVLGGMEGGMVDVGVTGETPDRDVCQRDGQTMTTPLTVTQHVPVDIATTVHLKYRKMWCIIRAHFSHFGLAV